MSKYKKCLNDILNHTTKYNLYFACLLLGKFAIELNISEYQFKQDINSIKAELDSNETSILGIKDALEVYSDKTIQLYDEKLLKQLVEEL